MPIVASSAAEYELKRQLMLQEYDAQSKVRKMIIKSKEHFKDTGISLYQTTDQRTSLETLIDSRQIDENLKKKLVNDLNSDVGVAKSFIQSLDEPLKQLLLNRFPLFKEIFEDNFTISSTQNLRGAYNLFQNEIVVEDKSVKPPSIDSVEKYLRGLNQSRLEEFITVLTSKGFPNWNRQRVINMPKTVENGKSMIQMYLKRYNNNVDGYMSLYSMLKMNGFDDIPKPKIEKLDAILSSNDVDELPPDVPTSVPDAVAEPIVEATPLEESIISQFTVREMKELIVEYNEQWKNLPQDVREMFQPITRYRSLLKKDLARLLAQVLFNTSTGEFEIFNNNIGAAEPIDNRAAAESDDELPQVPVEESKGDGLLQKHKYLIKKHIPGYVKIY